MRVTLEGKYHAWGRPAVIRQGSSTAFWVTSYHLLLQGCIVLNRPLRKDSCRCSSKLKCLHLVVVADDRCLATPLARALRYQTSPVLPFYLQRDKKRIPRIRVSTSDNRYDAKKRKLIPHPNSLSRRSQQQTTSRGHGNTNPRPPARSLNPASGAGTKASAFRQFPPTYATWLACLTVGHQNITSIWGDRDC